MAPDKFFSAKEGANELAVEVLAASQPNHPAWAKTEQNPIAARAVAASCFGVNLNFLDRFMFFSRKSLKLF